MWSLWPLCGWPVWPARTPPSRPSCISSTSTCPAAHAPGKGRSVLQYSAVTRPSRRLMPAMPPKVLPSALQWRFGRRSLYPPGHRFTSSFPACFSGLRFSASKTISVSRLPLRIRAFPALMRTTSLSQREGYLYEDQSVCFNRNVGGSALRTRLYGSKGREVLLRAELSGAVLLPRRKLQPHVTPTREHSALALGAECFILRNHRQSDSTIGEQRPLKMDLQWSVRGGSGRAVGPGAELNHKYSQPVRGVV